MLKDLEGITLMWDDSAVETSSHFAFPVLFASRDARIEAERAISARGIQTTRYPALHQLTEYAPYAAPGSLPRAEAAAERHLALPLSSGTTADQIDLVVDAVEAAL